MPRLARSALALAAIACAAPAAHAQVGAPLPREFGLDGGVTIGLGDLEGTAIQLPAQNFRVGFFRSPVTSIEPYGSLNFFSVDDVDVTQITFGTGLLYHFSPDRTTRQAYVRPFAEVDFVSGEGDSEAQFGVGAGLGLKVPWQERFAWRFEGAVGYAVETDNRAGGMTIGLLAGLSFFSR